MGRLTLGRRLLLALLGAFLVLTLTTALFPTRMIEPPPGLFPNQLNPPNLPNLPAFPGIPGLNGQTITPIPPPTPTPT
jgi:hypothetical protein